MPIICSQCHVSLPVLEDLTYRFCPNCGTAIGDEKSQSQQAFGTIPPNTVPKPNVEADHDIRRHRSKHQPHHVLEHTLAPHITQASRRPPIKPPSAPRPADFFRETINEHPLRSEIKKEQHKTKRKVWIWLVFGIGAGIVLIWWILHI